VLALFIIKKHFMKTNKILPMIIMLLIISGSCNKSNFNKNYGFDCKIDKKSYGTVIAKINSNTEKVYLIGDIILEEGEIELYLTSEDNELIYRNTIVAPTRMKIDETFDSKIGYWKLKYKSNDGIGDLKLRLNF